MTLVDSNIWVSLALSRHPFHDVAKQWLEKQGKGEALFCRSTQQSFLRHITNKVILAHYGIAPLGNKAAWSVYEGFRADKRVAWADEPRDVDALWKKFSSDLRPSTKLWTDAYLAAFAVTGGYRFVTADQGFKQFKNLDLVLIQ